MRISQFGRCALSLSTASVILAGCGSQSIAPFGTIGPSTPAAMRAYGRGWVMPEAQRENLVYAATSDNVYVLSYPAGKLVGALNLAAANLCADQNGNVFVLPFGGYEIVEYPHGGYVPIATLHDIDEPLGCAVDPMTGNLASTNESSGAGEIAIFPNAQEPAHYYRDPQISSYGLCGYDGQGNLFVDGTGSGGVLAELPKGSTTFANFALGQDLDPFGSVQWDGTYVTLTNPTVHAIYRVVVAGSALKIVGTTHVHRWYTSSNHWPYTQTWLQDGRFIGQSGPRAKIGLWQYPTGGSPRHVSRAFKRGTATISGLTLSLAQH